MEKNRSYAHDVVESIAALKRLPHIKVQELGKIKSDAHFLPFYKIIADNEDGEYKRDVLISGGVHGDEPAGVWTILKFLAEIAPTYLCQFRFFVYPCVNPSGYEYNTRKNVEGFNLNREFKLPVVTLENRFIVDSLCHGPAHYLVTLDLHESDYDLEDEEFLNAGFTKHDNPRGFFVYELLEDRARRFGRKIIDAINHATIPICTKPTIFGDLNSDGVVWYPEGYRSPIYASMTTFEGFLIQNYTDHAFTIETISNWDSKIRVKAHLLAVTTVLDAYRT